jgi:hypothetical protein
MLVTGSSLDSQLGPGLFGIPEPDVATEPTRRTERRPFNVRFLPP